eukprot:1328466-Alexandrium_andersonii.AAC.1
MAAAEGSCRQANTQRREGAAAAATAAAAAASVKAPPARESEGRSGRAVPAGPGHCPTRGAGAARRHRRPPYPSQGLGV